LRHSAFKSYNDYIRQGRESDITENMRDLYIDNLKSMLYLFSDGETDEIFTLVEINRQLERFDKCNELLEQVDGSKWEALKKKFSEQVAVKNTRLFRLY
jgi:hypothetical protein